MASRIEVGLKKAWLAAGLVGAAAVLGMAGCSKESPEVKACKNKCPIETVYVCTPAGKEYANQCFAKCAGEKDFAEGVCSTKKSAAPAESKSE